MLFFLNEFGQDILRLAAKVGGVVGIGLIVLCAYDSPVVQATGIPRAIRALCSCLSTISSYLPPLSCPSPLRRFASLCFESRNPLMALLYWALVLGGYAVFIRDVLPLVATSPTMSDVHLYLHLPAVVATLTSFVAAAASDPGRITKANVASFSQLYPADGVLYSREAKDCDTCGHVRVPRSKHCRILKCHVARYDHYCPWIVNVVGHYNTRYFHAFLWATSLLCAYESYLTGSVLWHLVQSRGMLDWQYKTPEGALAPVPRRYILGVLIRDTGLAFPLGIFCSAVAVFTALFALYHVYLVVTNVTTNETVKWDDVRIMVRDYGEPGERVPANRYNRGIVGNIREVLFPAHARDATKPTTKASATAGKSSSKKNR